MITTLPPMPFPRLSEQRRDRDIVQVCECLAAFVAQEPLSAQRMNIRATTETLVFGVTSLGRRTPASSRFCTGTILLAAKRGTERNRNIMSKAINLLSSGLLPWELRSIRALK